MHWSNYFILIQLQDCQEQTTVISPLKIAQQLHIKIGKTSFRQYSNKTQQSFHFVDIAFIICTITLLLMSSVFYHWYFFICLCTCYYALVYFIFDLLNTPSILYILQLLNYLAVIHMRFQTQYNSVNYETLLIQKYVMNNYINVFSLSIPTIT